MKLILFVTLSSTIACSAFATDQFVQGYTKSNGTYVQPYHRSAPDNTRANNYGTEGNTNPYTGKAGTEPVNKPYEYKPKTTNTYNDLEN